MPFKAATTVYMNASPRSSNDSSDTLNTIDALQGCAATPVFMHVSPRSSNESSDMLSTIDARARHVREAELKERAGKVKGCRGACKIKHFLMHAHAFL